MKKMDNKKKQMILWTIIVIVGLVIAGYFLLKSFSGKEQNGSTTGAGPTTRAEFSLETEPTTSAVPTEAPTDPVSEATTLKPEDTTAETFELETPEAPTINTDEPTTGEPTTAAPTTKAPSTTAPTTTAAPKTTAEAYVYENQQYSDKDHVAAYIHEFGHLPSNYITKSKADNTYGWQKNGYYIGGDYFGNYERKLPTKSGRKYYECDISYSNNNIKKGNRGTKRLVYSNDGLIFYTEDHYEHFTQLYP